MTPIEIYQRLIELRDYHEALATAYGKQKPIAVEPNERGKQTLMVLHHNYAEALTAAIKNYEATELKGL